MSFGSYPTWMPQQMNQPVCTGAPGFVVPQQMQQPAPTGQVIRLVASKAEVVAAQIPFDGTEYYFKDTSSGKIYGKAFNFTDGTAPVVTYSREIEQPVQYATLDDLSALRAELEAMRKPGRKAGRSDDSDES